MGGVAPKVKTPPTPQIPPKDKDKKTSQKDETKKDQLHEETPNELRRKKLDFTCKDPWEPGHRCLGKGKIHYIEVVSDRDNETDTTPAPSRGPSISKEVTSLEEATKDKKPHPRIEGGTITTLSRVPKYHTFKIKGVI